MVRLMVNFDYPYTTRRIRLDNEIEIAYVDEGQGSYTLLMIHGLGSYLPAWQKNIEGLKGHFRCIALDLPNYGKSSRGNFPFTMDFFARTIQSFIEILNLKNVVLVGHSMGGQIAVTSILDTAADIHSLVLLAPAGFEVFSEADRAFFDSLVTPEALKATPVEQIALNFALNFSNNQLPEDARFMFEDRLQMRADEAEYDFYCNMVPKCVTGMLNAPIFDRLTELTLPTLILFGQEDLLIPNKYLHPELSPIDVAQSGQREIQDSELHILSPCGHFVQWECPGEVNRLTQQFLHSSF